jgi:kumamolisin
LGQPVGFLQPFLYSAAATTALHDITTGSNGAYSAGPGWDACTGLGSPAGAALLAALQQAAMPSPGPSPTSPTAPVPAPPPVAAPPAAPGPTSPTS